MVQYENCHHRESKGIVIKKTPKDHNNQSCKGNSPNKGHMLLESVVERTPLTYCKKQVSVCTEFEDNSIKLSTFRGQIH